MKRGCRGSLLAALLAGSVCARAPAQEAAQRELAAKDESAGEQPTTIATVARCIDRHEQARVLRVEHRLVEALDAANGCVSEDCPLTLRADCTDWQNEIAALLPSVVLVIEGDAGSEERVHVTVDGVPLATGARGAPLVLAPGVHHLRFELPPHAPVEQELSLAEGQKNHVLRVRFDGESAAPRPVPPLADDKPHERRPIPLATWALGGAALASAGATAILFGSALSDRDHDAKTCAPICSRGARESIERRLVFADVGVAAALVLGSVAIYTYLHRPTLPVSSTTGSARPCVALPALSADGHGLSFSVHGSF